MYVGGSNDGAVCPTTLTVHTNVPLHAKVLLLPLAGLMDLGVAFLRAILGGAGSRKNRGVHNGIGLECHAAVLWSPADFGKQWFTQFLLLLKVTDFDRRGGVRYGFASKIDADKTAETGAVIKCYSRAKSAKLNQC